MAYKKALVDVRPLTALLEWCNDAIDFNDDTDRRAAKAFHVLQRQLGTQRTSIGCKHGTESGFLCHFCGKVV